MSDKVKLSVGQTLYFDGRGEIGTCAITAIGRKYLTTDFGKYNIDGLTWESGGLYTRSPYNLYISEQAIADAKQAEADKIEGYKLSDAIRNSLRDASITQLREIAKILNITL